MSKLAGIPERVIHTAEQALQNQNYVSLIDVLTGIGLLHPVHVQEWQKGKIPYLEQMIQGSLEKIFLAIKSFHNWVHEKGLKPNIRLFLAKSKDAKKELQFTEEGLPEDEIMYKTYYICPTLSEKKLQQLKEKFDQKPEVVIFRTVKESQCSQCNKEMFKGSFLLMEADQPLCMACAGLSEFVFVPSGDSQLTRKAKKNSTQTFVVVQFSRTHKRYERQGILVQEEALQKAQQEAEGL